ncbi:hypothetical protein QBC33DRAFT_531682 [Phialemonium atrogriseum]|uniref:Uncharacterized protein n=1 Tax=Phialemonium atrogriseum TaxID=1093897 RepID=A0AAJ0C3X7_9PEZI|nr:uncharacterized protein QBC33DRAFT_531682 [Phialemonium atrogriseum]KAK1769700.1 hypothetical protein QBC33DRAFT_531682 [Phialemonium atrogriseum]
MEGRCRRHLVSFISCQFAWAATECFHRSTISAFVAPRLPLACLVATVAGFPTFYSWFVSKFQARPSNNPESIERKPNKRGTGGKCED